jgi:hypothetical protein
MSVWFLGLGFYLFVHYRSHCCCMSPDSTSAWFLGSALYLCVRYGSPYAVRAQIPPLCGFWGQRFICLFAMGPPMLFEPRSHLCVVSGVSALSMCSLWVPLCCMSPDPSSAWFLGSALYLCVRYGSPYAVRAQIPPLRGFWGQRFICLFITGPTAAA